MHWIGNSSVQHYRYMVFTFICIMPFLLLCCNTELLLNRWMSVFAAGLPASCSFWIVLLCRGWSQEGDTCYDSQSRSRVCWAYVCYFVGALQREMALLAKSTPIDCLPSVREISVICTKGSFALCFSVVIFVDILCIVVDYIAGNKPSCA